MLRRASIQRAQSPVSNRRRWVARTLQLAIQKLNLKSADMPILSCLAANLMRNDNYELPTDRCTFGDWQAFSLQQPYHSHYAGPASVDFFLGWTSWPTLLQSPPNPPRCPTSNLGTTRPIITLSMAKKKIDSSKPINLHTDQKIDSNSLQTTSGSRP